MKNCKLSTRVMVVMMTILLSLAGGLAFAAKDKPMVLSAHSTENQATME